MLASCNSGGDGDGASASTERTSDAGGTTAAAGTPAQPAAPRQVRLLRLGSFDEPTYLTAPRGDARRFVVERPGRIRVVRRGKVLRTPFLDISDLVTTGGESGLLSMAFPPDYARSGRFYVYYTDSAGFIRIDQFRRAAGSPNRADRGSRRLVLRVPHHRFNHKGGQLQFGPDGKLYAGFGDGGGGGDPDGNGQNLGRQLAKLIRIAPRAGRRVQRAEGQPVPGTGRRASEDLRVRPAQPVPVLVRPPDRQPHDRRRGPGCGGGDRLRAESPRARPRAARGLQLRLERLRGAQPVRDGQRPGRASRRR